VSLLAEICKRIGRDEEAAVYIRRVPADFKPTRIARWTDPHQTGEMYLFAEEK
jgi:hypothetical protein